MSLLARAKAWGRHVPLARTEDTKDWADEKVTKLYSKKLLVKSLEIISLLPVFYLIMWVMKSPKSFEKIAILKI